MEGDLRGIVIRIIVALILSFFFSVAVHEAGHLAGGCITGYKLTEFTLFWVSYCPLAGGRRWRKGGCLGQCLMHPRTISQNGRLLIIGGIAANLLTGIVSACIGLLQDSVNGIIFSFSMSGMNIAAAIINFLSDSPTNDGSTFTDAGINELHMEMYNRLMLVYMYQATETRLSDIPQEVMKAPEIYDSTLSAELSVYRYMAAKERFEHGKEDGVLLNEIRHRLKRYIDGTGIKEGLFIPCDELVITEERKGVKYDF